MASFCWFHCRLRLCRTAVSCWLHCRLRIVGSSWFHFRLKLCRMGRGGGAEGGVAGSCWIHCRFKLCRTTGSCSLHFRLR